MWDLPPFVVYCVSEDSYMYVSDGNWPPFISKDYTLCEYSVFAQYAQFGKTKGRCSKDKVLGVTVHKYNPGAVVCKCGKSVVPAPKNPPRRFNRGPYSNWNPLLYT